MFVEIHLIQNFSPSNLNRDDTNSPKDCEFGGVRRARISSQCLKKAIRQYFNVSKTFSQEDLAIRTKRITDAVVEHLKKINPKRQEDEIQKACANIMAGIKIKIEDGLSQYLLFLGDREFTELAKLIDNNFDKLISINEEPKEDDKKKKSSKDDKKSKEKLIPSDIVKKVETILDGGKAVDLALFGRMIADLPKLSREAACQVAHAISTHRVAMESDYYTAIDDLSPSENSGAGMLGTVDFNSSCFYRYAVLDLRQLEKNLLGDRDLVLKSTEEFVKGMVHAIPTGKQNSMAAHNPPSAILVVVRKSGQWSLANAFEKPVRQDSKGGLIHNSIIEMCSYFDKLSKTFGNDQIVAGWLCCIEKDLQNEFAKTNCFLTTPTLNDLFENLKKIIAKG